uniref:Uncharacterized protein n=1 Tax=Oryza brachyantha TaxID=4533 RepID=J3MSX5_ORYBR
MSPTFLSLSLSGPWALARFDPVAVSFILEVVAEVPRGSEYGKWHPSLIILI